MAPTVESTIALIREAHAGQIDKIGAPYAEHPLAVMALLPPSADDAERMIALLHDVVEDTGIGLDDLRRLGYAETVIEAVALLTIPPDGRPYARKIAELAASGNVRAIRVKLADNLHNADPERCAKLAPEQRLRLAEKYGEARTVLTEALTRLGAELPG